jgi:hypothetical protein
MNEFLVQSLIYKKFLIISSFTLLASVKVEKVAIFYQEDVLPSASKLSTHSHHLLVLTGT